MMSFKIWHDTMHAIDWKDCLQRFWNARMLKQLLKIKMTSEIGYEICNDMKFCWMSDAGKYFWNIAFCKNMMT